MKKFLSILLILCLTIPFCSALALEAGDARTVIGADNSTADIEQVYSTFGIERGSVPELTITNADERSYLEGQVADSALGTHAISCVYIEILPEGEGLEADVHNVTVCTREMYIGALTTAGISDARVTVVSPLNGVSGTAALAGIFVAYEDMSGEKLDEIATDVAVEELTTTADLAEDLGSEQAAELVNEIKANLDELQDMSDEEVQNSITSIAGKFNITLSDKQMERLFHLVRNLEKLDVDKLVEKAKDLGDFFADAADKAGNVIQKAEESGFFDSLFSMLKKIVLSIVDFFRSLF